MVARLREDSSSSDEEFDMDRDFETAPLPISLMSRIESATLEMILNQLISISLDLILPRCAITRGHQIMIGGGVNTHLFIREDYLSNFFFVLLVPTLGDSRKVTALSFFLSPRSAAAAGGNRLMAARAPRAALRAPLPTSGHPLTWLSRFKTGATLSHTSRP